MGGVSGFGFALVSLTLLSLFFNIKTSVVFLVVHTLVNNILQLIRLKRQVSLKKVLPLILGAITGVPVGVMFLKKLDPWWIQKGLAVIILYFILESLTKEIYKNKETCKNKQDYQEGGAKTNNSKKNNLIGYLVGLSSGSLMGGFMSGGPPVVIYSIREGSDKFTVKAILQSFFLFSSAYAMILYIFSGMMTSTLFYTSIQYLPATLLGTFIGIIIFERLSYKVFKNILLVFMVLLCILLFLK